MAVTNLPKDKFAFLFSGSTNDQYLRDLEKVYETLTDYYNYPKENIWVIEGGAAFTGTFPGVVNGFAVPDKTGLLTKFSDFANKVQSNNASLLGNDKNTVFIYFTGVGDSTAGVQKLIINTLDSINTSDFTSMIDIGLFSISQVNIVMQQDYCGGFDNITDGLKTLSLVSDWSFTGACDVAQTNPLDVTGSAFTKAWVAGLQFEIVFDNVTLTNVHADELTPVNPAGYELLISIEQAKVFAEKKNGTSYIFDFSGSDIVDTTYKFLGRPAFIIRDSAGPYWWESPDIYLSHPNNLSKGVNDLYIPDDPSIPYPQFNNTINVIIRNKGTHPVRSYAIYIEKFPTGVDSPYNYNREGGHAPKDAVLKPVPESAFDTPSDVYDLVTWNSPFWKGVTHDCIRAEAQLLDTLIDPAWDVTVSENEAQRNTDISGDPPAPEGSKLHKLPGHRFRGTTRHMYFIKNPFKETHQFFVTFPFDYNKAIETVNMNWQLVCDNENREAALKFTDIDKKTKGFLLELKGGERKSIIFEFGFKYASKEPKLFRIPLEILVDRIQGEATRKPIIESLHGKFAAIAGLTVYLERAFAHLSGTILDKKGNIVPNATIHLSTINGLQDETFNADKNGKFHLEAINPDIYKIKVQADGMLIHEQTLYLMEPKKHEHKFNLEALPKQLMRKKK